ncbi:hypothetical protein GCM10020331_059910 [Ectobacillus funiculus]
MSFFLSGFRDGSMLEEMKIGEKKIKSPLFQREQRKKLYVIVTLARRAKLYLPDEPLGGH